MPSEYADGLAKTRPAITLVPSIVHNAVRDLVMDGADREEIRAMREEVRLVLEAGTRTLSFGLVYMPGAFSEIEELIELAEAGATFGVLCGARGAMYSSECYVRLAAKALSGSLVLPM